MENTKEKILQYINVKKRTNDYYVCECPFGEHGNDRKNPQFIIYRTGFNAFCSKCNKSYSFKDLATFYNIDYRQNLDVDEKKQVPLVMKKIRTYYREKRKLTFIPTCEFDGNDVFIPTFVDPENTQKQFQKWIYDIKSNKDKRLNKKGKIENFLYIPLEWNDYKPKNEKHKANIYLCEGIPDCLTLLNGGYKAISYRSKLVNEKGREELKSFIEFVKPQLKNLIVIPDQDAFQNWKKIFKKLAKELYIKIEVIDISIYYSKKTKFDVNDLWVSLNNPKEFRNTIEWLRKQMYLKYGNIIKDFHNRCYYRIAKKKDEDGNEIEEKTKLSNFVITNREYIYNKVDGEAKRRITIYYKGDSITKVIETKVLGDYNKFREELNKINDILFFSGGASKHKPVLALEDRIRQTQLKIIGYEEFGTLTKDLTLFKNIAFYKNKPYLADSKGLIKIDNQIIKCNPIDAPKLRTEPGADYSHSKLYDTIHKLYGNSGVFTLCFVLASVRLKNIIEKSMKFPLLRVYGERGSGKTTLQSEILKLFGLGDDAIIANTTATAMYRIATKYNYLPIVIDDVDLKSDQRFQVDAYNRKTKVRAKMTNNNEVHKSRLNAIILENSNIVPDANDRNFRRKLYLNFKKHSFHLNPNMINDLSKLSALTTNSNLIYDIYSLDIDIESEYNKAVDYLKTELEVSNDHIINYSPIIVGLTMLFELKVITEVSLTVLKSTLVDLINSEVNKNSTENETTLFLEFVHKLSIENERKSGDNFMTTVNPNIDYAVREQYGNLLLVLKPNLIEKVNEKFRKGFDTRSLEIEHNEFFIEKKKARIGSWNSTAWIFDLSKIKEKLGFDFREDMSKSVSSRFLHEDELLNNSPE